MIRAILALLRPKYVYRRADTGKFCSKAYAAEHPDTTVRERVK